MDEWLENKTKLTEHNGKSYKSLKQPVQPVPTQSGWETGLSLDNDDVRVRAERMCRCLWRWWWIYITIKKVKLYEPTLYLTLSNHPETLNTFDQNPPTTPTTKNINNKEHTLTTNIKPEQRTYNPPAPRTPTLYIFSPTPPVDGSWFLVFLP